MKTELIYKNNLGEVLMTGDATGDLRICEIEGLGPVQYQYNTTVFGGYDGQKTLSKRALQREITLSLELVSNNMGSRLKEVLRVLEREGVLYLTRNGICKRIRCNQVRIPDIIEIIKGQISTFAVQFVCDSPFFEDGDDTVISLYKRNKNLATPFELPSVFGNIILGGTAEVKGVVEVEPVITIYYPETFETEEMIILKNCTTDKSIELNYIPVKGDTVVIDVKNRRITSSQNGNIINCISDSTFFGDFILKPGKNIIEISVGDVASGFSVECKYSNIYTEAVI